MANTWDFLEADAPIPRNVHEDAPRDNQQHFRNPSRRFLGCRRAFLVWSRRHLCIGLAAAAEAAHGYHYSDLLPGTPFHSCYARCLYPAPSISTLTSLGTNHHPYGRLLLSRYCRHQYGGTIPQGATWRAFQRPGTRADLRATCTAPTSDKYIRQSAVIFGPTGTGAVRY